MGKKYQNLREWITNPFGTGDYVKNNEYDKLYKEYISSNRIRIAGYTMIEDSYYVHVTVPSGSKDNYKYDVVIRFFTGDPSVKRESTLMNYSIQFFSNSPGFIYRYAVLYKKAGFLIEELYEKMDKNYADTLPEKSNSSMKVSYDKTIYFATKFLAENRFKILHKRGILRLHLKSPDAFFRAVGSFEKVKMDHSMIDLEKRFQKELRLSESSRSVGPASQQPKEKTKARSADPHRVNKISKKGPIKAILSKGNKSGITVIAKKRGGKSKKVFSKMTTRKR